MIGAPAAPRSASLMALLPDGASVRPAPPARAPRPPRREPPRVVKEPPPDPVRHDHLDAESLGRVVEPLVHARDPGEHEREPERDRPIVEARLARAQAEPAALVDGRWMSAVSGVCVPR